MSKTDARERATLLLFESESKDQTIEQTLGELEVQPDKYAIIILESYSENTDKVNNLIAENSKGWAQDRLPVMDRAILRMAITELNRSAEVPVGTIISEAVFLSEKYSTAESPKFINGVLGTVAHKVRGVELLQAKQETD